MKNGRGTLLFFGLALFLLLANMFASAQVSVLTQHNDLGRTGQNLNETTLTPSNVNPTNFGLQFKLAVDNQVYSQPLVAANVSIAGGTHNVVYVATTNNSVYAFDAENGTQYWHVNLGTPISNANYGAGCVDINGNAGIVGTPVINPSTGTLYVVNSLNNGGAFSFMLHALDISTGANKAGSPVQITHGGFSATAQNQRAGLQLASGHLLIPFSSHCDMGTYHGFLFSYDPTTLAQLAVFNTSPTGNGDSLWGSGQGPAVDASGNIYFGTSNGTWDGVSNFSESFIKLSPSLGLLDWFTAANHANLDGADLDLDTSGAMLIPPGNRLVMVGKSSTGYVVDSASLGHLGDGSAVQTIKLGSALHGSAVYWDSALNGPEVYMWSQGDNLKAFQFNGNDLNLPNFQTGPDFIGGEPGAFLSLSANGNTNGIVWANAVLSGDANHGTVPGVLRAYDANKISTELYNNQQNAGRDSCNNFAKDGYATIANGKVYLGSFGTANAGSGQLCVYGLFNTSCPIATVPGGLSATTISGSQINLSWTASTAGTCTPSYSVFRGTTSGFTPSSSNQIATGIFGTTFSDTTATPSTTYFYVVEALDPAGASSPSNQASATSGPAITSIAINAGGPAVSPFLADEDFAGGTTITHANTIDLTGVTNPAPMAVYQTARIGNFTYTIGGFAPGSSQKVRLHFAETFFTTAGSRTFNVSINGTQVLTNFDIFATAGATNKAVIEEFTENADAKGIYTITTTTVVNNALISGIEIVPGASTCSTVPTAPGGLSATATSSTQINLSWGASTASGCTISYKVFRSTASGFTPSSSNQIASGVGGTTFSDSGLGCNTAYFYLVQGSDSAGTSAASNQASATTQICTPAVRINAGGPAVSPFVADADFTGGVTIDHANTIDLSGATNPAPMAVYQSARVAATIGAGTTFSYTIPGFTANSSHSVRLHFAETFWTAAAKRVFNVSINGTQVLTNFDIFAAAGAMNKAVIRQFTANANASGQYVITFTTVTDKSLVSGIEIQ
ncbi:MAG TPA: malectin domain-containing carbohydrate-binding protein [Terriglobales bacterium]|nr:malectin domain-containing carbohydrate-binding protein [Terriglobales bacterium]